MLCLINNKHGLHHGLKPLQVLVYQYIEVRKSNNYLRYEKNV
jgi:hypothetical protein